MRRKAAGTIQVTGHGRAAHSGSAPDRGRNALLALGVAARRRWPSCHDPDGAAHLTAVPTVMRSGEAFNVVPGSGELYCDLRADELDAIEAVLDAIPAEHGGVRLESELIRRWPGMHSEEATAPLLRARVRGARAPGRGRLARRGERRQPHRRRGPGDRRRARPARRRRAQPGRVRARGVAASRAEVALAVIDAAL